MQVEAERLAVEALVHQPNLRDAAARELDGALEQPAADPASLHARIDGDRANRRHGAARMDPREADHLPVVLGERAAERIDGEQMADVAAALSRRPDAGLQTVRERDPVEGDEVEIAHPLDLPLL